jgi:steroid delta-isomerase-like uncharacterized protein
MDPVKVARENVEAFTAGDWKRLKATLAPNSVYEELATQRRIKGADEIAAAYEGWKKAFPDAKGKVKNAVASGDTVTLEITWEGTQTGPLEGPQGTIPASGKRTVVEAAQVVKVRNDKIEENRHFFDMLGLLRQIGAAPK